MNATAIVPQPMIRSVPLAKAATAMPATEMTRGTMKRRAAAPRYGRYPRPGLARSGFFVLGNELGRDRGGEFERAVGLVVDGGHVEGLEELDEFFGFGGLEGGAQVGEGLEHGLDLGGPGAVGPARFEVAGGLLGGGAAGAEVLDAPGGEGDDGVVGVVVLLEAQALAVERPVDGFEFQPHPGELGVVLVPALGDRSEQARRSAAAAAGVRTGGAP